MHTQVSSRARAVLLVVFAAIVLALPAMANAATLAGSTTVGSSVDSDSVGQAEAFKTTAAASGTISALNAYLDSTSTASKVELGIYSGSTKPSAKVASCVVSAPKAGWNACTATGSITSGQVYWVTILQPAGATGTLRFRDNGSGGTAYGSSSTSLASLPASYTTGPLWGGAPASIYASSAATVPPPSAAFSASPASPNVGDTVTFDASASTCAATPCVYHWHDIDGSGTGDWPLGPDGQTMTFAFQGAGTKYVELVLTDGQGRVSRVEHDLVVGGSTPPPPPPPAAACADGQDNDQDGLTDYPADPGCSSATDNDETDPAPPPPPPPPPSGGCDQNATSGTLSSVMGSASAGQTICLAAGSYSLSNAQKQVTLKPDTDAGVTQSQVTVSASGSSSSGWTLDGVSVSSLDLDQGSYHDLTVRNSRFTGQAIFHYCGGANTNIVLDGNTHTNIAPQTYEGRIHFPGGSSGGNCGVTIKNSTFSGGCSDGIQSGADGVQILNNEFFNIVQGNCSPWHTDSIQFYGASGDVVRGNYFHNVEDCIMAPDGTDHEVVERNVCVTSNTQYGFTFGADIGSTIRHNVLRSTGGGGGLRVYGGNPGRTSQNTVATDNVVPGGGTFTSTGGTVDYNLWPSGPGAHNVSAQPSFVGGTSPSTYAGHALTAGTAGTAAASDGTDIGI